MSERLTTQLTRVGLVMPYVLAVFFGLLTLRGVTSNHVINTDAARHAMNGAFIHDLVLEGQITNLMAFSQSYYSRLPALSLPYHPPVFAGIEAIYFFVLGVNVLAARLAVATAVSVSFVLLYQLIVATHQSRMLGVVTTVTFLSTYLSQVISRDVFLDFPMMVFVLGALHFLKRLDEGYLLKHGLAFAVLAGTAVWTKQHAVFLGLVPFVYVVLSGRWRLLTQKTIWLSSVLFGGFVLAWVGLCVWFFNGSGIHHTSLSYPSEAGSIFLNNLKYYVQSLNSDLGTLPAVLLGLAFVFSLAMLYFRREEYRPNLLYVAWTLAAFALLLLLGDYSNRYLLLVYPPLFLVGYFVVHQICSRYLRGAKTWYIPIGITMFFLISGLRVPALFMHGPMQVASHVTASESRRVLYCGQTEGSFIFALRSLDPQRQTMVIRGDKLPGSIFSPDNMEQFAHEYGINYIIVEQMESDEAVDWRYTEESEPWASLTASPATSMHLETTVPLRSSVKRFHGELQVYRFTRPSAQPKNNLDVPSHLMRGSINLSY